MPGQSTLVTVVSCVLVSCLVSKAVSTKGSHGDEDELQVPKFLGTWYGVAVASDNGELLALMHKVNSSVYHVEEGANGTVVIHGASFMMGMCIRETKHFNLFAKEKILIPFVPDHSSQPFSDFVGDTNATYRFLKIKYESYSVMQQYGYRNGTRESILYLLARNRTLPQRVITEFNAFTVGIGLDKETTVVVPNSVLCLIKEPRKPVKEKDSKEAKMGENHESSVTNVPQPSKRLNRDAAVRPRRAAMPE
uniref:Uncharacterized protein LOC116958200 isoform X2 n=1 Tax=Petromyzon marinus TaxID=7757 RepID=A0AAJ7UJX9_PETMA|nr:uncharacterized protein LOC116958200 isoform X2 [Petromyzon marinus]XP_032836597.1 uncharacterized protein LOC116958200 isoform X3 [Petromyzon marinus]